MTSSTDKKKKTRIRKIAYRRYLLYIGIIAISVYLVWPLLVSHKPSLLPKEKRLVAIGDLHGDMESSLEVFKLAKLIDDSQNWIGGDTILVQTGDIVDRGPDAKNLYLFLIKLTKQAEEVGGKIIQLLGNHEIMNLINNWDYVTDDDIQQFGGVQQRLDAWDRKSGWLGQFLLTLNITTIVNSTVFVHGGIHPQWASHFGFDQLNLLTRSLLSTKSDSELEREYFLFGPDSPTWYRGYAQKSEEEICPLLDEALKFLNVERMVVGHTPQNSGKILSKCNGKFIDVDVGISKVYGRHHAALEIYPDRVIAIYPGYSVQIN